MLRSTATRSLLKSISRPQLTRSSYTAASVKFRNSTPLRQLSQKRPQLPSSLPRPTITSLLYATKPPVEPINKIDREAERRYAQEKLEPHPEEVSTKSSVRPAFEGSGDKKRDDEVLGSIKADIRTVKDTFGLKDVPKEPLYLGIAGVLPYAVTSLSTVYLAYDLNHTNETGKELLFSPETAQHLLDMMLPIQVGYGAVVSSQKFSRVDLPWTNSIDNLLPRSHPLGLGVCRLWRAPRLPAVCIRRDRARGRVAHAAHARRGGSHHAIPRLHLPVLRGRARHSARVVPPMVLDVPFRADVHRRRVSSAEPDRARPDRAEEYHSQARHGVGGPRSRCQVARAGAGGDSEKGG